MSSKHLREVLDFAEPRVRISFEQPASVSLYAAPMPLHRGTEAHLREAMALCVAHRWTSTPRIPPRSSDHE